MRKIAIIGGTGVYSPDALGGFEEKVIKTPYGDAFAKWARCTAIRLCLLHATVQGTAFRRIK